MWDDIISCAIIRSKSLALFLIAVIFSNSTGSGCAWTSRGIVGKSVQEVCVSLLFTVTTTGITLCETVCCDYA